MVLETSALIGTVVGYLAKTLKENKSFKKFTEDFTDATVDWIKPLFLTDDKPSKLMLDLEQNPDDHLNQSAVATELSKFFRDNPDKVDLLRQLTEEINKKEKNGLLNNSTISNNSNFNVGNVNVSQGNVTIGSGNQTINFGKNENL